MCDEGEAPENCRSSKTAFLDLGACLNRFFMGTLELRSALRFHKIIHDGSGMKLGFWQGHSNFMDPSIVEYGGSFELIFTRF